MNITAGFCFQWTCSVKQCVTGALRDYSLSLLITFKQKPKTMHGVCVILAPAYECQNLLTYLLSIVWHNMEQPKRASMPSGKAVR